MNIHLYDKLKQYNRTYYASKKLKNEILIYFYSIKISEQTLKLGHIEVN